MSFGAKLLASAALATASFLVAPAALAASHPVQVSGAKLKSALLPASSFGSDWEWDYTLWSKGIWHFKAVGGTNDSVPASMMLKLINRVKKLR